MIQPHAKFLLGLKHRAKNLPHLAHRKGKAYPDMADQAQYNRAFVYSPNEAQGILNDKAKQWAKEIDDESF